MSGQSTNPAARNIIQHDAKVLLPPKPSTSAPTTTTTTTLPQTNDQKKLKPANVFIFNHQEFDDPEKKFLDNGKDVEALKKAFNKLQCCVQEISNATLETVINIVQELKLTNFDEHSALVIVILSHGSHYDYIAAKDETYSLQKIILLPILDNNTLTNKPKMFFTRAGKGVLEGYQTDDHVKKPSPSEIFKCCSTFEGYTEQEPESGGSTFIQTLCEALERDGKTKDIQTIMREVQAMVYEKLKKPISLQYTMTVPYTFGDFMDN
ncbi:uncharacterized protein Dwil_GK27384 [Drosophila willistoni]|uniref:Caspase family p20 domain-containing protein n=2 Tax=Drosophila willistoni TaxID=7260 RepID=A0A0Q9WS62_DROWI|nr:uncharacterized protein Dwil_GK27384 [Drosophila willistoni]